MNKKEIQAVWDKCLIQAYRDKALMIHVLIRFFIELESSHIDEKRYFIDPKKSEALFAALRLNRSLDQSGNYFIWPRFNVKAHDYILARSKYLYQWLNDENTSDQDILFSIKKCKWKKQSNLKGNKVYDRFMEKQKEKSVKKRTKFIRARSLSPTWSTVK